MLVNCFMVYRKEENKHAENLHITVTEEEAISHVNSLIKTATDRKINCKYYYDSYQIDVDEEELALVKRK